MEKIKRPQDMVKHQLQPKNNKLELLVRVWNFVFYPIFTNIHFGLTWWFTRWFQGIGHHWTGQCWPLRTTTERLTWLRHGSGSMCCNIRGAFIIVLLSRTWATVLAIT